MSKMTAYLFCTSIIFTLECIRQLRQPHALCDYLKILSSGILATHGWLLLFSRAA